MSWSTFKEVHEELFQPAMTLVAGAYLCYAIISYYN